MTTSDGNREMVERLKSELNKSGPRIREVVIPDNVGWVPCPNCMLPFKPGGICYFDTETARGVCDGCGIEVLTKEAQELDLPF